MKRIKSNTYLLPLVFVIGLLVASCTESSAPVYRGPEVQILGETSYRDLETKFNRYSYRLDNIENGIPPLILRSLPDDLSEINSSRKRKAIFLKSLLPMVLLANNEIHYERQKLEKISRAYTTHQQLDSAQEHILASLANRYDVKLTQEDTESALEILQRRIDIIPADLALAQAANESAWGTSRFSRVANNLFGEWTFQPGQGIVPLGRPEGETYEVQKFNTVYDSVRSYLHNLNTHPAYRDLRKIREQLREQGKKPNGLALAEGLLRYSVRGEEYVRELKSMIRKNRLDRLAQAKLRITNI